MATNRYTDKGGHGRSLFLSVELNCFVFFFISLLLATLWGMWDVRFPSRIRTQAPWIGRCRVLTMTTREVLHFLFKFTIPWQNLSLQLKLHLLGEVVWHVPLEAGNLDFQAWKKGVRVHLKQEEWGNGFLYFWKPRMAGGVKNQTSSLRPGNLVGRPRLAGPWWQWVGIW